MPARRTGPTNTAFYLDLGTALGEDWENFRIAGGLFYHPSWRRGFTAGELRAMFYQVQVANELTRQTKQLKADAERQQIALDAAEQRAGYYRQQLILESRYGLMLTSFQSHGV
jgi:hypothetical protein